MKDLLRLRPAIPQSAFIRGAMTIAGGTGAAQLLTIVVGPLLTRLYSPSDYGAYAVAASILALLIAVACLGYEAAIPLPRSDREAGDLLVLCLIGAIAIGLALVPILLVVDLWPRGPEGGDALDYLILLPLGAFGGGAISAFTGFALRMKAYDVIASTRVTQSVVLVATQIGLGVVGAGATGLLTATVVASLAAASRLGWAVRRAASRSVTAPDRSSLLAAARRYRRFPLLSAPSLFLNTLGLAAPVLAMVALYGTDVGGQFAFAQRVVGLPAILLGAAVAQVYFGEAAALAQRDPAAIQNLFRRTTRTLALGAIVPFVVGAILAPFLFGILFGPEWQMAGLFAAILAPMYFLQFVSAPASGTLDILERQDKHLTREILRIGLLILGFAIAAQFGLAPAGAVIAVALSGCLTYAVYGISAWRAILAHRPNVVDPADTDDADLASHLLEDRDVYP